MENKMPHEMEAVFLQGGLWGLFKMQAPVGVLGFKRYVPMNLCEA